MSSSLFFNLFESISREIKIHLKLLYFDILGNGSTFEEISKSNFKALALPIPPKQKLEELDAAISPVFRKIRSNQKQIQTALVHKSAKFGIV
jgi:restriction endonuclease S subunit